MKNIYLCGALVGISALGFAGCGDSTTTVNVNANRAAAGNSNVAVVTNANNSVGGSVANSISNMTSGSADSPNEFMMEAAAGGMNEVEMSKIAATKATNAEVKKFAQMMVADHTKANTELKALAAKKNVQLPAAPDSSGKSMVSDLQEKTGAEFDSDYVEAMVDAHETDVANFQKQAQSATDPEVKAFAAKTLPTLQKHLEQIKAIQAKMP